MVEEVSQCIDALLKEELKPDPDLPCRTCGEEDVEDPIYDKDLGGPYCDNHRCLEDARLKAMQEYILGER